MLPANELKSPVPCRARPWEALLTACSLQKRSDMQYLGANLGASGSCQLASVPPGEDHKLPHHCQEHLVRCRRQVVLQVPQTD